MMIETPQAPSTEMITVTENPSVFQAQSNSKVFNQNGNAQNKEVSKESHTTSHIVVTKFSRTFVTVQSS